MTIMKTGRILKGFSQAELGAIVGIPEEQVVMYENSGIGFNIPADTARQIADAIGFSDPNRLIEPYDLTSHKFRRVE